ncbi:ribokinase [[Kitasatospora] papulosa]|uniref:Ribokinase n=1 Tax=[Kitasatospora] papulosa TaxID=1464011 RepID=A0ABZ1K9T9_9ACTN|nr:MULTISPECIES: ribokinase [Streptomyces]MDF9869003.1 ribokinase [Streptomyces pratensis]TPM95534.1 ribokinase [Mesorhizobium sp. B2-3-3]MCX4416984.1 ribokinase [[Kitasatospora] papulosa]MDX2623410.1 ribokinase [Streptomyces sp. WI03-5b]MDX3180159.1 ribokinase [Streptomyces sp. ME02-7008A-1]
MYGNEDSSPSAPSAPSRYDLLVVGSANADLVVGVERRPGPGETVLGTDLVVHPGGKGANQAVAAARLGARTALLARVGDDAHGRLLRASQQEAGVDTGGVLVGGAPTGVALITVDPSGDNSIVVSPGANARLTPDDVRAAGPLFASARVVSVQLEIPLDTVAETARALGPGARLVLNPSPPAPLPGEVLAACDPLVLNEHEARSILGDGAGDTPEAWARGLTALGPRSVVITLGAEGALVSDSRTGEAVRVPSPRVAALDTTGAGDAFTAALAWRLGLGEELAEAAAFAVRVGAAAVTKEGAQASFPTAEEVSAL